MPEQDSSEQLLRRICELQERQLEALEKLSENFSLMALAGRESRDLYKSLIIGSERHRKSAVITGALMIVMLGSIASAILIAHFL